ncbi:hypothetical protein BGZ95_011427 [Linnemannia exigua]|uniref:Uncharacterized protein n=1 Tax=Linnemannia exigua TaxID=604196 RepID=A0AAD4H5M6_9FUNG|nr:hypothetical protein BGZ95_011427 [Linnemannia exigua]
MNNTLSSFQQDLALEQDSRHFYEEEKEHITHAELRSKKPLENEGGLKNLGLAIMVIFQSKRSALRRAMADLEAESAIAASLRSLTKHVETTDMNDQGELVTERMREVYRPFLDKIIKKSDPDKETAFLVLEWLLLKFPYRALMIRSFGDDLSSSNDKKRKLAVLVAMEDVIDIQIRPRSATSSKVNASKSKSKFIDEEPDKPSVQPSNEIKSTEDKERTQKPALVVEVDSGDESKKEETDAEDTHPYGLGFVNSMKAMHTIIKYFLLSDRSQVDVATAGMTDILDMLVRFNRHHGGGRALPSREIMFSFAQSWKLISAVLVQRRVAPSSEEILKQAQAYSQMNEIPPYLRLLTAGLLLGYCGPPSQFESAIKTSSELRSTLLGLANVVILENIPVGQVTAIAVQSCLVQTLSEAEVQDMKTKIVAILDNPSEISLGSANVASSYMATYPELFVPALLARLRRGGQEHDGSTLKSKADIRKVMNSLYIVEAMAERYFFDMVLSTPASDLRRKLEYAVIDLFREKDISVRVTLGQIVASLNPSKIIGIYAPEVSSSSSIVRSRADRVDRSKANKDDSSIKIKTPSQLLEKTLSLKLNPAPPSTKVETLDKLLRVIKTLGETTPSTLWGGIFTELVAKSCGSPSDAILARVWAQLSQSIVKSTDAISTLFVILSETMEQQGELTEERVEAALEASDEALDDMRLARLVPLSILKMN